MDALGALQYGLIIYVIGAVISFIVAFLIKIMQWSMSPRPKRKADQAAWDSSSFSDHD